MAAIRRCDWRKVRYFGFVWGTATAFVLLLQWTGWRPISDPATLLAVMTALVILRQGTLSKRKRANPLTGWRGGRRPAHRSERG